MSNKRDTASLIERLRLAAAIGDEVVQAEMASGRLMREAANTLSYLQEQIDRLQQEKTECREQLQWAERQLTALVTEDDGSGAFIRGTGTELAGFGAGMERLRGAIKQTASAPTGHETPAVEPAIPHATERASLQKAMERIWVNAEVGPIDLDDAKQTLQVIYHIATEALKE